MGNNRSSARSSMSSVHSLCPLQSDDTSNTWMYEEPLLGDGKEKSVGHAYHLQQFLYADPVFTIKQQQQQQQCDPTELRIAIHQLNSFFAVLWPVCITMICASLAACNIHDADMKHAMTVYMYYQDIDSSNDSLQRKSVLAFCNALIVIGFIACLTFGVVLLYKFNCMRFFFGYCIFYSATLLGLAGAKIAVIVLCNEWHWIVDAPALALVMYNFAVVGVLSIFYQKGIPVVLEQAYLVASSVIVAWQLSQLPEWSVWMLLLLLGFWDLFAVMTPIGPLRWLVDLVHEKGTPLPGLVFQADIVDAHVDASQEATESEGVGQRHPREAAAQKMQEVSSNCITHPAGATSERKQWRNDGNNDNVSEFDDDDKTIKLGLGDFIFYSVLTARAATYGMAVFVPCFLCILVGLAVTMYLLGRFDALPALPISIFLGIVAYLFVSALVVPFLEHLATHDVAIF